MSIIIIYYNIYSRTLHRYLYLYYTLILVMYVTIVKYTVRTIL